MKYVASIFKTLLLPPYLKIANFTRISKIRFRSCQTATSEWSNLDMMFGYEEIVFLRLGGASPNSVFLRNSP